MKFTTTFAVMALINNISAIAVRDDDDLFTDSADEKETLASISQAEKAHGAKLGDISKEDQAALTTQKTKMTFNGDNFVMNERRVYGTADKNMPKGSLLMLEDYIYPEPRPIAELLIPSGPRPIGVLMMQIEAKHFAPNDTEGKVLSGAQLNDDDDTAQTLASLKASEAISGNKMTVPESNPENFSKSGTEYEDFLAREQRVSTKQLEDALTDKIPANSAAEREKSQK